MNPTLKNPTRRDFGKTLFAGTAFLAVSGFETFEMWSCQQDLVTVITDIEDWAPTAEKAVNSIVALIGTVSPTTQAAVQVVEAAINQVLADVQQYLNITPPPVGLLAKIQAGLTIVANNFQSFLDTIKVTNPLVGTVVAIAQVIFAAIAGFINSIVKHAAASVRRAARAAMVMSCTVNGVSYPVSAKEMNGSQLKASVNSTLDKARNHGVNVPQVAYIQ